MSNLIQKLKKIPSDPGCYLFKNKAGQILYIGKAKSLKKRVSSYWQKNLTDAKTRRLVQETADLDFIVTDSELEALLLEAKLIKENQPPYNLELKGGVRYAYLRITNELFPRLETVRFFKRRDQVFGPYASSETRKNLIRLANSLFKLRVGKRKPSQAGDKYLIHCSTAPWRRLITPEEYQRDIAKAKLLLQGKMGQLVGQLTAEMKTLAAAKQFELAKMRRDQIAALEHLRDEQKVQLQKSYDQDVINFVVVKNKFLIQLFNISKGVVSNRQEFKLALVVKDAPADWLASFLSQYYYSREIPQEVIVPIRPSGASTLAKYLSKISGRRVRIAVPKKGTKLKLLELVKKNIVSTLKRGDSALFELQTKLKLPTLPSVIECFDVSNLGASQIVGSMVYFKDGLPDKNNYRRFKIKFQRGQSDFDAMSEIVWRRYARLKQDSLPFPDLVLVDGGKPQLSAARQSLRRLGLELPVAALAKKQEELFLPGQKYSLRLARQSDALKLVQRIRDEAHRFAIAYHRLLRGKF